MFVLVETNNYTLKEIVNFGVSFSELLMVISRNMYTKFCKSVPGPFDINSKHKLDVQSILIHLLAVYSFMLVIIYFEPKTINIICMNSLCFVLTADTINKQSCKRI